ncbi:hypothetical protein J6TS7_16710 [Paenibacillus dendritiformis]|nr:hypothetical protein J6TS7_16710 [Paenibacillus dendritiformis]
MREDITEQRVERLWYRQPAGQWAEALPVGNGRLGAMQFGGVDSDRLQLNEDSVWHGGPAARENPDAAAYLPVIRQYLLEGRPEEAERIARLALTSVPKHFGPYQTLGELKMFFHGVDGEVSGYSRELSLSEGIARVEYTRGGIVYSREAVQQRPRSSDRASIDGLREAVILIPVSEPALLRGRDDGYRIRHDRDAGAVRGWRGSLLRCAESACR